MNPILVALAAAALFAICGVLVYLFVGRTRKPKPPLPQPGREVIANHTGKTFVVEKPSKDMLGRPRDPVVRCGAISVVWPRKTFHNHFKPK